MQESRNKLDKVLFSGFFDRFIETEIKLTIVLHVPWIITIHDIR